MRLIINKLNNKLNKLLAIEKISKIIKLYIQMFQIEN